MTNKLGRMWNLSGEGDEIGLKDREYSFMSDQSVVRSKFEIDVGWKCF